MNYQEKNTNNVMDAISFCDRKADNVRVDEYKALVLDSMKSKYNIDINYRPYICYKTI